MNLNYMKLLMGIAVTSSFISTELPAWHREAKADCKKAEKKCKKAKGASCEQEFEDCKQRAEQKDQDSFASSLNPLTFSRFRKFTPEQKKKAMDMADKNRLPPDDAVNSVARQSKQL